ncbi:MAG: hypothetical protein AAGD25_28465 [Cyanobacteria bacterium P01_F01_bin.150]
MDANFDNALVNLKQVIKQLSVRDRWMLLKWLIELLQHQPQAAQPENTPEHSNVNFEAVHQICDEFRRLPILDHRSPEEIIGYDQFGGLDS